MVNTVAQGVLDRNRPLLVGQVVESLGTWAGVGKKAWTQLKWNSARDFMTGFVEFTEEITTTSLADATAVYRKNLRDELKELLLWRFHRKNSMLVGYRPEIFWPNLLQHVKPCCTYTSALIVLLEPQQSVKTLQIKFATSNCFPMASEKIRIIAIIVKTMFHVRTLHCQGFFHCWRAQSRCWSFAEEKKEW